MKEILICLLALIICAALGIAIGDLIAMGPFHRKRAGESRGTQAIDSANPVRPATAGAANDAAQPAVPGATAVPVRRKSDRLILTRRDGRFNYTERQAGESCGGYAAAYVMRHFGIEQSGREIYARMKKVFRGYVQVREVRRQLQQEGLASEYCRGDLDVLREELDRGDPVILLVRARLKSHDMHFVVAAGYGRRTFFLADSARGTDLKAKEILQPEGEGVTPTTGKRDRWQDVPFNRVISDESLLEIWNTAWFLLPLHKFTYIRVWKE